MQAKYQKETKEIQAIPNRPWKKRGNDLSTANLTTSLIITDWSVDFWELTDFLDLELLQIKKKKYLGRNEVPNSTI